MERMTTALCVSILLLAALAGCSGGSAVPKDSPDGANTNKPSNKKIVIEYWSTPTYKNVEGDEDPNYGDWEQRQINEFIKQNPNVTINFQMIPYDAIEQRMTVALTGNNAPDILLDGLDRRLMKYVKFDKNEAVDDFIETDRADYNEDILRNLSKDGRLYGIPITTTAGLMFINKKIFEEKGLAGLLPADRSWTTEQWRDAMRQVSGDGIYGTALYAANEQADEMLLQYLFGAGAELWNQSSTRVVLDEYPAAVEILQQLKDMVDEGIIAPGTSTNSYGEVLEMFKQGKIAMMPWSMSMYSIVRDGQADGSVHPDLDLYGIIPIHKEGIKPKKSGGITGYTIFKQDDPNKREMVKKFVQFMTTTEKIRKLAKSFTVLPARISAFYEFETSDMNEAMAKVSELPPANLGTSSSVYTEVRQMWYPALQALFLGQMTPKQAIADYVSKANKMIDSQK